MSWWTILKDIPGAIGAYATERMKLKAQKELRLLELEEATHKRQIELRQQGLTADATWELESLRAHAGGWKDEAVLVVLLVPLVMVFVPKLAPYALQGFQILEQTPTWYRGIILLIFGAVYGIRLWRRQQSDT